MAKKFTDKQLSTILSHAHEMERLGVCRTDEAIAHKQAGCIMQVAFNHPINYNLPKRPAGLASAFDASTFKLKPTSVLRFLEKFGVA
jgi:hypothetical protein